MTVLETDPTLGRNEMYDALHWAVQQAQKGHDFSCELFQRTETQTGENELITRAKRQVYVPLNDITLRLLEREPPSSGGGWFEKPDRIRYFEILYPLGKNAFGV